MAKHRTSRLEDIDETQTKGFGSADIFSGIMNSPQENISKAAETGKKQTITPESDAVTGQALSGEIEIPNVAGNKSNSNENCLMEEESLALLDEAKRLCCESPIKKTSVRLHPSSLNCLAYLSRKAGVNQNCYLTMLLLREKNKHVEVLLDFENASKPVVEDAKIKGVQLPEEIVNWGKEQAVNRMIPFGTFIDEILQELVKKMSQPNSAIE